MPDIPLSPMHMTALSAAAMRAHHMTADGYPKILEDHFAQRFLGTDAEQLIANTSRAMVPRVASAWILRSRFAEDRLAQAKWRNVHQYVMLGAGLDSYALRHAHTLDDLIAYEVDDPILQKWKRQRLEDLQISVPKHLQFVPCDFEATSLVDALAASTFDASKPSEVSWLGVTQYLTREMISATLRWAASLATGSEIVLTYVVPGEIADGHKSRLAARGIDFKTFLSPDAIQRLMKSAGLVHIQQVTPEEAQSTYFANRTDGLMASDVERLIVGQSP